MNAFPTSTDNGHLENQDGMSLRDYFAAKAMQGLLSTIKNNEEWQYEDVSIIAYRQADAMMKER